MALRTVELISPGVSPYRPARARSISICTVGWPSEVNTARSVIPRTPASTFLIWFAVFVRASRSSPNSLIEFSPFTPDTASETLSCRYCEEFVLEFRQHFVGQLFLGHALGPGRRRFQGSKKLGIEKPGGVGAIVRTSMLRDHAFHFGEIANDRAHLVDVVVPLVQRDGRRQRRSDPEIALFE